MRSIRFLEAHPIRFQISLEFVPPLTGELSGLFLKPIQCLLEGSDSVFACLVRLPQPHHFQFERLSFREFQWLRWP